MSLQYSEAEYQREPCENKTVNEFSMAEKCDKDQPEEYNEKVRENTHSIDFSNIDLFVSVY
jgi:hypothetical protein